MLIVVVDALDQNHMTPLYLAARAGHYDVVRLLVDAGAELEQKSKEQATALYVAAGRLAKIMLMQQNTVEKTL